MVRHPRRLPCPSIAFLLVLGHSPVRSERSEREGGDAEDEEDDDEEEDDEDDDEEATEAEPEGFSEDSIIHVSFDNGKDDSNYPLHRDDQLSHSAPVSSLSLRWFDPFPYSCPIATPIRSTIKWSVDHSNIHVDAAGILQAQL